MIYMHMGLFYSQLVVRHIPKLRSKNSEELNYEILCFLHAIKHHSLQLTERLKGGPRENLHTPMKRKLRF